MGAARNVARSEGGCYSTTFHFSLFLFGFFVLDRPTPSRASGAGKDGSARPLFSRWRGSALGGGGVLHRVLHPSPLAKRGRSRPKSSMLEGSDARQRARANAPMIGAMTRRVVGLLLTVSGTSWWCGWHWPGLFLVDDPVAALVHRHTPNLYRAIVAWYCVAPGAGVSVTVVAAR